MSSDGETAVRAIGTNSILTKKVLLLSQSLSQSITKSNFQPPTKGLKLQVQLTFFFDKSVYSQNQQIEQWNKDSCYLYANFIMKVICRPIPLPDLGQGRLRDPEAKVAPVFKVERARTGDESEDGLAGRV